MSISIRNASGTIDRVAGFSDVDAILSPTSSNPIQNRSVYNALAQKIEKTVNDLVNYYTKSDVYNKTEVRELINAINALNIEVVETLPTEDISDTTIYFVGPTSGTYEEYVYINNSWVKMGGGGSDSGLEYVDTLPSPPDIKDVIYGCYSTDTNSMRFYAGDEDNQVLYLLSNEGGSTQPLFIDSENYISIDYDLI